jgi:hypothetical protein
MIFKFLEDHHPFLLKIIRGNNIGSLPFLSQLYKVDVCDLFLPMMHACIPLFKQFSKGGMDCFQDNISKRLKITPFVTSLLT